MVQAKDTSLVFLNDYVLHSTAVFAVAQTAR